MPPVPACDWKTFCIVFLLDLAVSGHRVDHQRIEGRGLTLWLTPTLRQLGLGTKFCHCCAHLCCCFSALVWRWLALHTPLASWTFRLRRAGNGFFDSNGVFCSWM